MADPTVVSLDIETYGACERNAWGQPLPPQTVFQPHRSLATDKVALRDLVLTCSITLPQEDPRCNSTSYDSKPGCSPSSTSTPTPRRSSTTSWCGSYLARMNPGQTMVFQLNRPTHRRRLLKWLEHADTIVGMNLQFDLQYLRAFDTAYAILLDGRRHFLIDLSIVNYLHDEIKPERSLKSLGPVLRTHAYLETLKHRRFPSPNSEELISYNAQDTHNTLLCIVELSRRILAEFQDTDKLSPWALQHYSDTIWSCIRMSESGIPMDRTRLLDYEQHLLSRIEKLNALAVGRYGLKLHGPGSAKGKDRFIDYVCHKVDGYLLPPLPEVMTYDDDQLEEYHASLEGQLMLGLEVGQEFRDIKSSPLVQKTPAQKKVSFCEENRNFLASKLHPQHDKELLHAFRIIKKHANAQKLVGSYCYPLLRHRRTKVTDQSGVLLPPPGVQAAVYTDITTEPAEPRFGAGDLRNIWLGHPTWYITPSPIKDDAGAEGGTKQGRITCKKPPAQVFPPVIKKMVTSRYGDKGSIEAYDLSQIELRVAALLSGERTMLAEYQKSKPDLHTQRAVQIFTHEYLVRKYGEDYEKLYAFRGDSRGERQVGKHVNFGDLFEASAETMQATVMELTGVHIPLELFQTIVRNREKDRPDLYRWHNELVAEARRVGYIALPFTGQSRWFLGGEKWDRNEIVNMPVQTTAGNTLLAIQNEIHKRLPPLRPQRGGRDSGCHMILQVYDSMYFDVRSDLAADLHLTVLDAVQYVSDAGYWCMLQDHYGHDCPLIIEHEDH